MFYVVLISLVTNNHGFNDRLSYETLEECQKKIEYVKPMLDENSFKLECIYGNPQ